MKNYHILKIKLPEYHYTKDKKHFIGKTLPLSILKKISNKLELDNKNKKRLLDILEHLQMIKNIGIGYSVFVSKTEEEIINGFIYKSISISIRITEKGIMAYRLGGFIFKE